MGEIRCWGLQIQPNTDVFGLWAMGSTYSSRAGGEKTGLGVGDGERNDGADMFVASVSEDESGDWV
eukprot:scaffold87969_cov31-Tisochrysis_lutea.AAC.4